MGGGGVYRYVWGEADSLSFSFLLLDVPTFQPSFFQEIFMHVDRILAWEKERERERLVDSFHFSFQLPMLSVSVLSYESFSSQISEEYLYLYWGV